MPKGWIVPALALLSGSCSPTAPVDSGPGYPGDQAPKSYASVFEVKTDQVEVGLGIDPGIQRYPALYERLKAQAIPRLQAFSEEMTAYRREDGITELAPYSMDIRWAMAGETEHLASFEGYEDQYGGGNHPSGYGSSIFWDRAQQREVDRNLIFRPGSMDTLDALLCRAVNAEKRRRHPEGAALLRKGDTRGYGCLKASEIPFVLEPAASGQQAAGLLFLLGPNVGGAYAEGVFRIFLPTRVLGPVLADAYADQFSMSPRRR